ncbi:MAG TPA: Mrp/NBP35 family ATP-binding protein [Rhabdochlamydiaceae bacterium]|jgi:ATP-binding protein involved in chromosome partitioning
MRFVVGVAAGKGGVGKSSLTVNLALCLQLMGHRVGIMDADIYGPSIRRMLPEDRAPGNCTVNPEKIIPAEKNGIRFISMAHFLKEDAPVIVRAPIVNGVIKQFFHAVEWGELDCLLIDFPPGTGDIQLTLMQEGSLCGGIVITTPQEVALQDVSKAIALFHHMGVPVLGLVENMSYFQDQKKYYPFGKGGGRRLALREGVLFLGEIPIDEDISRCCDEGLSLFDAAKDKECAQAFRAIANEVWDQLLSFEKLEGSYLKKIHLAWSP